MSFWFQNGKEQYYTKNKKLWTQLRHEKYTDNICPKY